MSPNFESFVDAISNQATNEQFANDLTLLPQWRKSCPVCLARLILSLLS